MSGAAMELLTTRYAQNLAGVLSCHGRIVITGTLPGEILTEALASFPHARDIRTFDCPHLALPLRERMKKVNYVILGGENAGEHLFM